jgi:hypothetical protein
MATSRRRRSANPPRLRVLWRKFERLFPTEETCVEELRRLLGMSRKCSSCANNNVRYGLGARQIKCAFCLKKRWLTAGTFFHRIRKIRPWLAAIFLLENGVTFNAFQFHKMVGVAYSTAFYILKKLAMVIQNNLQDANILHVPSSLFLSVFTKRSQVTPARKKPAAEQEMVDDMSSRVGRVSGQEVAATFALDSLSTGTVGDVFSMNKSTEIANLEETPEPIIEDPVEKAIYGCLSVKPVPYDVICERVAMSAGQVSGALTLMELSGLVARLPGDHYVRSGPTMRNSLGEQTPEGLLQRKVVDQVIDFIRKRFGGISRKYLQNYISIYWSVFDRTRWGNGSLLELCLRVRSVTFEEIAAYVSPPSVQIAAVES